MPRSRELKKVSDLFESYRKRLIAPESSVVTTFCEVVHDVCGVSVKEKYVSYKTSTRVLAITKGGPLKQEILLRKDELLAHLKGRLGPKNAPHEII